MSAISHITVAREECVLAPCRRLVRSLRGLDLNATPGSTLAPCHRPLVATVMSAVPAPSLSARGGLQLLRLGFIERLAIVTIGRCLDQDEGDARGLVGGVAP